MTLRQGLHGNASEKLKIEVRRGRAKCRGKSKNKKVNKGETDDLIKEIDKVRKKGCE